MGQGFSNYLIISKSLQKPPNNLPADKNNPYIFLDIDGVLNCGKVRTAYRSTHLPSTELLSNLKKIADEIPNLIIILSSTWRLTAPQRHAVDRSLAYVNLTISGYTPDKDVDASGDRPDEIFEYIRENNLQDNPWVAIDDMDMIAMNNNLNTINFCRTDDYEGLTEEKAYEVIEKLRNQ